MEILVALIAFSFIIGFLMFAIRGKADFLRAPVTYASAALIIIGSVILSVLYFDRDILMFPAGGEVKVFGSIFSGEQLTEFATYGALVGEVVIAAIIIYLGVKYKKYIASLLSLIQLAIGVFFEFGPGHGIEVSHNFYIDKFSIIMVLIIGIIGSLICVYAVPYMKDHAKHLASGEKDRRPYFFALLFIFLGAMFGIVCSNNLTFMFFFWEITTLCSFLLIGYTRTKEAVNNSFRAVIYNLLGGLAFIVAIVMLGSIYGTIELSKFLEIAVEAKAAGTVTSDPGISLILILLSFAGITKAAQMPFSSWLLGAMVAPTPTSALLHSSTMVKAGVFLIIKLSPAFQLTSIFDVTNPAFFVTMVGGLTFFFASCLAITQSNAKRVLAYSTIANLGLIITCAGIGTEGAVWAAIFLTIFHAVTKSLLFLCVGTAEHNIGSRDIEDMDGLFVKMPRLATCMIIGISAMYLAPFGMLISKWAALETFVSAGSPILILILCFGSAVTLFYWTKWLGKMTAVVSNMDKAESGVARAEYLVHGVLAFLVGLTAITFPVISASVVTPYLTETFASGTDSALPLKSEDMMIMVLLVVVIILLPLLFYGRSKRKAGHIYLAGAGEGDDRTYLGAMEKDVKFSLRNWYMDKIFGEDKFGKIGNILTICVIGLGLCSSIPILLMVSSMFLR